MFSVLMSVYHREKSSNLDMAIASIFSDTSLEVGELVLVIDGPIGKGLQVVIDRWIQSEKRINLVKLEINMGLGQALNKGLEVCKFEFVARMDSDDITLFGRWKIQYEFLNSNPDIAVVGGQIGEFEEREDVFLIPPHLPTGSEALRRFLIYRNPLRHPSVMFRRKELMSVGGYPDVYPEDWIMWIKLILSGYKLANLEDLVVKMRVGDGFFERRGKGFLEGEIKAYKYMLDSGLINYITFIKGVLSRGALRLSPQYVRKFLYRYLR